MVIWGVWRGKADSRNAILALAHYKKSQPDLLKEVAETDPRPVIKGTPTGQLDKLL